MSDDKPVKVGDIKTMKPVEWEKVTGIRVMDPDGWREAGKDYGDPVSLAEFGRLCGPSTVSVRVGAVWPVAGL